MQREGWEGNIVQIIGALWWPVRTTRPFFCTHAASSPYPHLPCPHLLLAYTLHPDTLPSPPLLCAVLQAAVR